MNRDHANSTGAETSKKYKITKFDEMVFRVIGSEKFLDGFDVAEASGSSSSTPSTSRTSSTEIAVPSTSKINVASTSRKRPSDQDTANDRATPLDSKTRKIIPPSTLPYPTLPYPLDSANANFKKRRPFFSSSKKESVKRMYTYLIYYRIQAILMINLIFGIPCTVFKLFDDLIAHVSLHLSVITYVCMV